MTQICVNQDTPVRHDITSLSSLVPFADEFMGFLWSIRPHVITNSYSVIYNNLIKAHINKLVSSLTLYYILIFHSWLWYAAGTHSCQHLIPFEFFHLFFRKRKAEDVPDSATKKIKTEEEEMMRKQNKTMYKHRDELSKALSKKHLSLILEDNEQYIPKGESKVSLGCLQRCSSVFLFTVSSLIWLGCIKMHRSEEFAEVYLNKIWGLSRIGRLLGWGKDALVEGGTSREDWEREDSYTMAISLCGSFEREQGIRNIYLVLVTIHFLYLGLFVLYVLRVWTLILAN